MTEFDLGLYINNIENKKHKYLIALPPCLVNTVELSLDFLRNSCQ